MNELLFFLQSLVLTCLTFFALSKGKETLIALIVVQEIFANLFVTKQITLFGLNATASDVFAISGAIGINLIQEYYGRKEAQRAIWLGFAGLLFYLVMSTMHVLYMPSTCDSMNEVFCTLFNHTPRIIIASLLVYLVVQQLDYLAYGALKKRFPTFFISRTFSTVALSQLLDTILFSFLGLYGIIEHIDHIIVVSYAIKLAALCICTPALWFARQIISQSTLNDAKF